MKLCFWRKRYGHVFFLQLAAYDNMLVMSEARTGDNTENERDKARIDHVNRVKSRRDADNGISTGFVLIFLDRNTLAFVQAAWETRGRQKPLQEYYLSFHAHSIPENGNGTLTRPNAASLYGNLP